MTSTGKAILIGTVTAGTLDLLSAFVFAGIAGRNPVQVMQGVASGPFGPAITEGGVGAALIGVAVHYSIMAVMVTVFVLAARRQPALTEHAVPAGLGYGVLLYLVMYWVVLPLRFPARFPMTGLWPVGNALFSHCICVGLPIALIAHRYLARGLARHVR